VINNSSENADGKPETGKAIYSFMDVVAGEAEQYAAGHTSPMSSLLEEIESYSLKETDHPSMLTGRVVGRFLQLIICLSGFRDVNHRLIRIQGCGRYRNIHRLLCPGYGRINSARWEGADNRS